jgi:hypothetical protein
VNHFQQVGHHHGQALQQHTGGDTFHGPLRRRAAVERDHHPLGRQKSLARNDQHRAVNGAHELLHGVLPMPARSRSIRRALSQHEQASVAFQVQRHRRQIAMAQAPVVACQSRRSSLLARGSQQTLPELLLLPGLRFVLRREFLQRGLLAPQSGHTADVGGRPGRRRTL